MIIEYFGEFGKVLEIGLDGGIVSAFSNDEGRPVHGVGSFVDGNIIAAYCDDGRLVLYVGSREWRFPDEVDLIEFCKDEDGISRLTFKKDGAIIDQHAYRSWWLREVSPSPAGFGDADDQEHDIGAYLVFMFAEEARRSFLIRKWCR